MVFLGLLLGSLAVFFGWFGWSMYVWYKQPCRKGGTHCPALRGPHAVGYMCSKCGKLLWG